jgi:2-aminomuconate deaminase
MSTLAKPLGNYPLVKRSGNTLYLSGASARLPDGSIAGTGTDAQGRTVFDAAKQTRVIIEKIRAILESEGASLRDCVEVTTYLTRIRDFSAYNAAYGEYFDANGPARTTVGVSELPHPHMVVEIKAVAVLPD